MTERTTRDAEFGQFAGGFGGPLSRLAVLLVDDEELSRKLVVRALATLRSRWAGVEHAGAPEAQAVDALVSRLPRKLSVDSPEPVSAGSEDFCNAEDELIVQRQQAILRSWSTLRPRERAALLFTDASVAAPRLAGLPMPPALGPATRVERLTAQAWQRLEAGVRADPNVAGWSFDDDDFGTLLADCLRAKAAAAPNFAPSNFEIGRQRRHDLNRALLAAAGALVVIAVGAAAVIHTSSASSHGRAPGPVAASEIAPPQFTIVTPPLTTAPPTPSATPPADGGLVVDWPTRGTLAGNVTLASDVRTTFTSSHADLTGPVQVLLITDTTAFRIAYVTARTSTGSVGSWFYGNIGDQHLTEGPSSLGFSVVGADGLLSALLVYDGSRQLVALASPTATSMVVQSGLASRTIAALTGFASLDVTSYPVTGLHVEVAGSDGSSDVIVPAEVDLDLATPRGGGISTAGYPIQRGYPDPGLLITADQLATVWQQSDLKDKGVPDVLWGGNDGSIQQVVVRLRTAGGIDVVVIAWSGPAAGADAELLAPNAPDFPVTWDYPAAAGRRVGVLAPAGASKAQLLVDGVATGAAVAVDVNGYASLPEPAYAATVTGHTVDVALINAAGKAVSTISEPPPA